MAAALMFDAAPHMQYRHENQTRLEAAKDLGLWLVAQLPEQSEIAVLDTRLGATAAFQADRGAAKDRIERLEAVLQLAAAGDGRRRCGAVARAEPAAAQGDLHLHRSIARRLACGTSGSAAATTGHAERRRRLRRRRGRRQAHGLRPGRRPSFRRSAFRIAAT